METLFNLIWLAVCISLGAAWMAVPRSVGDRESLVPSVGVQIVALLMLSVLLLPAISVTDDFQAMTMPAESEHICKPSDLQSPLDHQLPHLTFTLVLGSMFVSQPRMSEFRALSFLHTPKPQTRGHIRVLAIRPPPAQA